MRRGNTLIILLLAVMLAGAWGSCDGNGGGDGEVEIGATPTILSTTSTHHIINGEVNPHMFDMDGNWVVWQGRDRDRVMLNDGDKLVNLANGLDELHIEELYYDGRFVFIGAKNPTEPCPENDAAWADSANVESWNRHEIYAWDTEQSNPELVMISDSWDGEHYIVSDNGLLVYAGYDQVIDDYMIYAIDLNGTETEPTLIFEDAHLGSSDFLSLSGTDLVFNEWGTYDLIHADLSDLSAAVLTTVTTDSTNYGQVSDGTVVWDYGNDIYAATIGGFGAETNLTEDIGDNCDEPNISGDYVAFACGSEIYIANVSDLANFDTTVGTGDVQQVTDNAYTDQDAQIAGEYLVWIGNDADGDDEIYAAQLVGGIFTNITQVSENYDHDWDGLVEPWENWYSTGFRVDDTGTVAWTEFQSEDTSTHGSEPWVEFPVVYTIGVDDAPRYLENYNEYQHIKQLDVVDGTAVWLTRGAFDRLFAKKVDSAGDPIAVTPDSQRARWPRVDGGLLAYQGKPAMECGDENGDFNEIWYINLNSDSRKPVRLTYNLDDDDRPVADGANGIVAWVNGDEDTYHYATISDNNVYDIDDDIDANCSPEIEDGKIVMRDDDSDIWVYDVAAGVYTYFDAGADRRPQISEGIVLWLDTGSDILYYTDLNDASGEIVQINDEVELGEDDGWNVNISAGKVIFEGYDPALSDTQVIFAYTVGDPTDSVEVIFTATNEDGNGVRQIDVDQDLVVWKYAECDPEIYYHNLSSGITSAITENYVPEHHPKVAEGYVVWRTGPGAWCNYYIAKP